MLSFQAGYNSKLILNYSTPETSTQERADNTVKVIFENSNQRLSLILDQNIRLWEVANIFASASGRTLDQVKFITNGKSLSLESTPQNCGLQDLDLIKVTYDSRNDSRSTVGEHNLLSALDFNLNLLQKRSQIAVFLYSQNSEWIVVLRANTNDTLKHLLLRYKLITKKDIEYIVRIGDDTFPQGKVDENAEIQNLGFHNGVTVEVKQVQKLEKNPSASSSIVNQSNVRDTNSSTEHDSNQDNIQSLSSEKGIPQADNSSQQDTIANSAKYFDNNPEIIDNKSPPVVIENEILSQEQGNAPTETIDNFYQEKDQDGDIIMENTDGENQKLNESEKVTQSNSNLDTSNFRVSSDLPNSNTQNDDISQTPPTTKLRTSQQDRPYDQNSSIADDTTELPPGNQQTTVEPSHPHALLAESSQPSQSTPKSQRNQETQREDLVSTITNIGASIIPIIDVDEPLCYKFHFTGQKDMTISVYEDQAFDKFLKQYKEELELNKDLTFRFMNKIIRPKDTPLKIGALADKTNTIEVVKIEPELVTFVLQDAEKKYRPLYFKAKFKTKLKKAFGVYADKNQLKPETLEFSFKGTKVQRNDTAGNIGLENGSTVDVKITQI